MPRIGSWHRFSSRPCRRGTAIDAFAEPSRPGRAARSRDRAPARRATWQASDNARAMRDRAQRRQARPARGRGCPRARPQSPGCSGTSDSPENAEKVVSPPRNPVTTSSRTASFGWRPSREERHADQQPAGAVDGQRAEREAAPARARSAARRASDTGRAPTAPTARRMKPALRRRGPASLAGGAGARFDAPRRAASSALRASTQCAPHGVCSFFQNGACVLR